VRRDVEAGEHLSEDELRVTFRRDWRTSRSRLASRSRARRCRETPRENSSSARCRGSTSPEPRRSPPARIGDVHTLEVAKFEPRRVVGRAVDLVWIHRRQFDGEQDAHRVDLVAVVATAHVVVTPSRTGCWTSSPSLHGTHESTCLPAPHQSRCAAGQPPQGRVWRDWRTNERDPSGVDEDAVGPDTGVLLTHEYLDVLTV